MNNENINTINTHTAPLSEPHSSSPSSPVAVDCCECGHCPSTPSQTSDSQHHLLQVVSLIVDARHDAVDDIPLALGVSGGSG